MAERELQEPRDPVRVVLRPVASSAPLAFFAFGMGTTVYTAQQLGWVPLAQGTAVVVVLLAFVAPLQLIAGLIAYASRDGGLATSTMMFGAIWVATAVGQLAAPPGARSAVLGIVLLAAAVMLLGIGAAAVLTRPLLFVLSMLAVARYALTGTYQLTGVTGVERASGWLGVPIALVALYGGIALLLEDTAGRTVLPTGRRNEASTAVRGELGDQVERIAQEAGVRRTL